MQDKCPLDKSLKWHALHSQQQAESRAVCHQMSHVGIVATPCGFIKCCLIRVKKRFLIRGHSRGTLEAPPPGTSSQARDTSDSSWRHNCRFDALQRVITLGSRQK